ncbi:DsbA family oxidoreductase [Sphingobacterium lactis]|uniref:Protein disulfide-isomerase n=1 Tax=Sphingobacterium lactis TaxID=797291 RepID=A0A1H5ZR43_9SPHI|nr:DsbA family oxidoreductase [Sphingobacterium lactis]SEG38681.1 protein disulfide-isomerase [Sphingobacterium lactis]
MLIEIWSDIMCPFCYIGKDHFEKALAQLSFKDELEVVYRSYQLDPNYHHQAGDTTYSYLSQSKGMPIDQVRAMTGQVVQMAKQTGLVIDFDRSIPANTFKSHELIHYAASVGKGTEMKGRLFKAHFEEGLNIEDESVLVTLATEVGLDAAGTKEALSSDTYAYEVKQDLNEAKQIGIRGVPFFLFNRKYAVSGAQPTDAFVEVLEKSFSEWRESNPKITFLNPDKDAPSCTDDSCSI